MEEEEEGEPGVIADDDDDDDDDGTVPACNSTNAGLMCHKAGTLRGGGGARVHPAAVGGGLRQLAHSPPHRWGLLGRHAYCFTLLGSH